MKVVYNRILPFGKKFSAINLFGVIFAKRRCDPVMLNHENIHSSQMRELVYVGFYLWYAIEWFVKIIVYRENYKAYRAISFEREAYANQNDPAYLSRRKHWSFTRYLKPQQKGAS